MYDALLSYPERRDELVAEDLDDDVVVYVPETQQAYVLNRTAAHIWRSCDGQQSIDGIARCLAAEYRQPAAMLLPQVQALVAEFHTAHLLRPRSSERV